MKKTFLMLPLLLTGTALAAQEVDTTDLFFGHLELKEVVVTGLTGDSRLKDTPAPVSVMRPVELQSKAFTNIINAIALQPGMAEVTTGSGISKPVIRGLGYNRIVVINDGIRQEGQQWGDEHGIEIDGQGVHSVEILKGPSSLMYGSDAMAGVVIFHPAPVVPAGEMRSSVSTEYQSNNGLFDYSLNHAGNRGDFIWNVRFSDKYAHAYRNRQDGYVPNSSFAERALTGLFGLNKKWGYSRLTLSWFQLTPGIVEGERDPLTGDLEGDAFGYRCGLPFQRVGHGKVVLDNTVLLGEGRLKVTGGWQQNRRREYEESADEAGLHFLLNTINYDVKYISGEHRGWKFATGVNGMYQHSENLGDEYLIPSYRLLDAGLFATVSKSLERWSFTGGLRGDIRRLHSFALEDRFMDFSRTFDGLTGSVGAVYSPVEAVNIRLNVARGFRAPNLSELASNGEHEGTLRYEVGNAGLNPEYSLQGDLGVDFSSKYVSGQVALFANRIDNYIYSARNGEVSDEGLPVYAYQAGTAFLKGLEAALDIHPFHSLHIGNTFSYVHARQKDQPSDRMYLPMIPAPRWTMEVKYEFSHGGKLLNNAYAAVNIEYNFAQNRYYAADDTETATPAYTLVGAGLGTDLVYRGKKRASVYILGSNLLDTVYQSHLSRLKYADINPVTGRMGVFNMGRNVTLKLIIPIL